MTASLALAVSAPSVRKPLTSKVQAPLVGAGFEYIEYTQDCWLPAALVGDELFVAALTLVNSSVNVANDNSLEEFHAASAANLLPDWQVHAKEIRPKHIFSASNWEALPANVQPYSDEDLECMAKENPVALAGLMLNSAMSPWEASFGAEYLGRHCAGTSYADLAIETLIQLLGREPSALREGAVYGLRYLSCERADAALQARLAVETVEGVRAAITESLGW